MRALGLLFFVLLVALPGRAVPHCDDDEISLVADARFAAVDAEPRPALPAELEAVDVIAPCALAESGDLGPLCVDATGYLVTVTGVVLCQMTLLEPVVEPLALDDASAPHGSSSPGAAVFATLGPSSTLAPPLAARRFVALPPGRALFGDGVRASPFVPG